MKNGLQDFACIYYTLSLGSGTSFPPSQLSLFKFSICLSLLAPFPLTDKPLVFEVSLNYIFFWCVTRKVSFLSCNCSSLWSDAIMFWHLDYWAELHPTSVSSGGIAALPCRGFCVYLRSRQFFTAYLCHSLRSAVHQVGGSLLWWLGWGFARDTILSAAKRDQCTPLNPISNCIIKTGSCSIVLIFLILTPFSVALSPSRQTLSADSHSGAFRDRNLVTAKTFRCVLIAAGTSYVSPSTPDATVGPSN